MWIVPPVAGLIEPAVAPKFYIDGIGALEISNGNICAYLYSDQMPLDSGGGPGKIVEVKLVGPLLNVPLIIGQLAQCLWRDRVPAQSGYPPRLVT
jgi:hypothetical protein